MSTTAASITAKSRLVPLNPVERDTVNKIFLGAVQRYDRPRAMLHKLAGEWRPISHRELEERATRLAAALALHGVRPGDRVAILSENRPEWAITDFAVLGMGAMDVPLYPTLPANQAAFILRDCGARAVFCSTREQLAKVQEIRGGLPDLRLVAVFDQVAGAEGARAFSTLLEDGERELESGRGADSASGPWPWGRTRWPRSSTPRGPRGRPRG